MKKLFILNAIFALSFLMPILVRAQDFIFNPTLDPTAAMGYAAGEILRIDLKKKAGLSYNATTKSTATNKINFNYNSTPALRQQAVTNIAKRLKTINPVMAHGLASLYGPGKADYQEMFKQMVQPSGLPVDNAATALAACWEMGYIVVNNIQNAATVTPAMDRGVQRQVAGILSQRVSLKSPVMMAQLGEEMKLQATLMAISWQSAIKSGQTETYRKSIAKQFRQMGLDLSLVRLSEQGLLRK
ncbi:hypothetical protein ABDD95_18920 [Mucilaginibacter sp. PAMB04274]|uniref:hypothetical protein n=1 Tax=Mucilaginibacter sp. PAMB04274 TaxID=3138568 RepID=UPI0031F6F052